MDSDIINEDQEENGDINYDDDIIADDDDDDVINGRSNFLSKMNDSEEQLIKPSILIDPSAQTITNINENRA